MAHSCVFGGGASSSGAIAVWALLKDTAANWSKHKAAQLEQIPVEFTYNLRA